MGTGRRMVLRITSRMFCLIDIVWSFLSGFVTSGAIRWNASEEFKAIWVFFAWSFSRAVALSSSRVLMSLPAKALANVLGRIPNESILNIRSRRGICVCRTLIPRTSKSFTLIFWGIDDGRCDGTWYEITKLRHVELSIHTCERYSTHPEKKKCPGLYFF